MDRLLERSRELRAIIRSLTAARSGTGGALLIDGPAGIGKTSLLAEARATARAAGMLVLAGRGTQLERSFAFGVVRQLYERVILGAGSRERGRLLAGAAGLAAPVFGLALPDGLLPPADDQE